MDKFQKLFGKLRSVIIGMVHLRALPGSPGYNRSLTETIDIACKEAEIYRNAKVDAIMVENMYDLPWVQPTQLGPETVASMSVACSAVKQVVPSLPVGVQVLAAANKEALAIAMTTGLDFIRAEGYIFSHIGDEGPTHACAGDLLRYRKHLGAENIQIFTDIKKKHCAHAITSDVTITDTAKAAELFRSDGVIVTGTATGETTNPPEVKVVQEAINIPVLVGSGVTEENADQYLGANAIIIGTHLKYDGLWSNDLDANRVKNFMETVHHYRINNS